MKKSKNKELTPAEEEYRDKRNEQIVNIIAKCIAVFIFFVGTILIVWENQEDAKPTSKPDNMPACTCCSCVADSETTKLLEWGNSDETEER